MLKGIRFILNTLLNSYSQIFFSNNKLFGVLLLIVSFFDIYAGISAVISLFVTVSFALLLGFNKDSVKSGYYSFNSVFTGLALGITYAFNLQYLFFLVFGSLLTFLLVIALEHILQKYSLPFLSLPFMLGIWFLVLAGREFDSLIISERGIYIFNDLYGIGGMQAVSLYESFNNIALPLWLLTYFKSLGAILFQNNLIAGIVISIGLLIHSRISFLLSLLGFFAVYNMYGFIGADLSGLNYLFIGFNFILVFIAIGSFFTIPNINSLVVSFLFIPITLIILLASVAICAILEVPVFSIPFNISVLLFLFMMKSININRFLKTPFIQLYSPERNLYEYVNNSKRFKNSFYVPLSLPFYGFWDLMQGHKGEHTHKGDWEYALDFEIMDNNKQYQGEGLHLEDYYCYNKNVLSPIDGLVVDITDSVADNNISEVNIDENWGNTIVIKYSDYLFVSLSHLKGDTIKVKVGDYVRKGSIIANVGNSGRSPFPHLHFQVQAYPYIGSTTLYYPISEYIVQDNPNMFKLKEYEVPNKGEKISNIISERSLIKAYNFMPGKKLNIVSSNANASDMVWDIATDAYNNTYLYCKRTNSSAYFINKDNLFMFSSFYGDKSSELFYFFLANYKILKGFYQGITLNDSLPLTLFNNKLALIVQDFVAPFYIFNKVYYQSAYIDCKRYLNNADIEIKSSLTVKMFGYKLRQLNFLIKIEDNSINYSYNLKGKTYFFTVKPAN